MQQVLAFVDQHWVPCVHVNRHLDENAIDYYEDWNPNYSDQTPFSCFFIPGYIGDLLKIDTDQHHLRMTPCTYTIFDELKPGRMFIFDIYNHVFTVLYLQEDEIYYIDFYMETDRPKYFRIERLTLDQLTDYIRAMQNLDFEYIAKFNQFINPEAAAAGIQRSYLSDAERLSRDISVDEWRWNIFKYMVEDRSYIDGIFYQEITYLPTLADILRVAYQSREELLPWVAESSSTIEAINQDVRYLEQQVAAWSKISD